MYSTIAIKKCKCGCGKNQTFNCGGYYYDHMPEEMKDKKGKKREVQRRSQNARKAVSVKLRQDNRKKDEVTGETELDLWFRLQMYSNERICQNCGISLHHLNEWAWRGSQHHCLEKSLFPTVATNPVNHLVLGYYCCHQQWHSSNLNASKMEVFSKAKEIVTLLYPLLTDREKGRISEYYQLLPNC